MLMGGRNIEEELEIRSRLVVSYAREIDYKNGQLWDKERLLEEKDKLLQDGRGRMQCLEEENKKLRYELDLQSRKEADGKWKYEVQLQSIRAENEKLIRKLEFNQNEFNKRVKLQQNLFLEMKRLKYRVESDTNEVELRLKGLVKQEKLEMMEYRANNAEKESMQLKEQMEEHYSRLNKCLQQKNEVEKKLLETNNLVNKLQQGLKHALEANGDIANKAEKESMLLKEQLEEHQRRLTECLHQKNAVENKLLETDNLVKKLQQELKDALETNGGRANKAEKESMLLKEQLEELRRRLNECLHQKNDLAKELSSFKTENNILVKQLREELRSYEYELQEARNLKSSSRENIQLLKKLEDELSSWKMMITEIPGVSCADDMLRMFVALQKEVAENMVNSDEANARLKQMEKQLEELKRRLSECLHQKNDLEKKLSSCRTKNNILVKQLREELRDYETELQDARKLKSSFHGNLELLNEKLMEEKDQRKRVESELLKLSEIQLRTKRLEDESCSWNLTIQAIPGVSCAADIPVKFAALQKELANAREAIENLKHMEEQQERLKTEGMIKAGAAGSDFKQMEAADAAILDGIPSPEMVEVPVVEIKGHTIMIEETKDMSPIETEELKQVEVVADPALLNDVASTEMVEVPILMVYERREIVGYNI